MGEMTWEICDRCRDGEHLIYTSIPDMVGIRCKLSNQEIRKQLQPIHFYPRPSKCPLRYAIDDNPFRKENHDTGIINSSTNRVTKDSKILPIADIPFCHQDDQY